MRERAHEDLARHERRRQRTPCRSAERRCDTRAEREREERPRLVGTGPRHGEQAERDDGVDRDRDREHRTPREAVGEMPCGQREQRQRDEHGEPDEPEIERVAADRVHLPADRDERHLDRDRGRDSDAEEEDEVAVPER